MGVKKRNTFELNWQAIAPVAPYPSPVPAPSGNVAGAMASTNTIYSNIMDVSNVDNVGLEVSWTGTPTGTISVMCSEGGTNFFSLTFNPALTQPAGSAGGYLINLNQLPFRFMYVQYVNVSGSGTLTVWQGSKDLN